MGWMAPPLLRKKQKKHKRTHSHTYIHTYTQESFVNVGRIGRYYQPLAFYLLLCMQASTTHISISICEDTVNALLFVALDIRNQTNIEKYLSLRFFFIHHILHPIYRHTSKNGAHSMLGENSNNETNGTPEI